MLVAVVTPDLHPTRESIKRRYLSQVNSKQEGNKQTKCFNTLDSRINVLSLALDCEFHYGEETIFYSTAVSVVSTVLFVLPSESNLLTEMKLTI